MGMTLAVLNGIQAFSMSWLNTKVPLYSKLIALKDYRQLDATFSLTLKQMSGICLVMLVVMLLGVESLRFFEIRIGNDLLANRFLDFVPMVLMMIPLFVNQFVASWATYLRCHKKEPFLLNSIVGGLLSCCSTIFLGKYFGVLGITGGYCFLTLAMMPWGYWLYKSNKDKWHGK